MDLHRGPERVRVLDHRREDGSRAFAFVKGMSLKGVKEVANAEVEEVAKDAEVAGVAKVAGGEEVAEEAWCPAAFEEG